MRLPAVLDTDRIHIQAGIGTRLQRARKIGGSAAVATTDLEDALASQVGLGGGAVIELDGIAVRFIDLRQWHRHRRIFLVAVVEEHHLLGVIGVEPASCIAIDELLRRLGELRVQLRPNTRLPPRTSESHLRSMSETGRLVADFIGVKRTRWELVISI